MIENNDSYKIFLRFLNEKHDNFKSVLESFLNILVGNNPDSKKEYVDNCISVAQALRNNVSASDSPDWLNRSINAFSNYKGSSHLDAAAYSLLREIIPIYQDIMSYKWQYEDAKTTLSFDFDALYEQCKRDSKIDELFDQIIIFLQKIIDSGKVDSLRILNDLRSTIAIIQKHNSSSYLAISSMTIILYKFIKNVFWETLESIPVLSPIIKGLRKTIEETGPELMNIRNKMESELVNKFDTEFNFLNMHPYNLISNK